ncbi:MAG: hypothetical protein M3252_04980, partial [Actinomycetota bacterium]|nr:hypothetical protein [Actinomycetota bacterium]
MRQSARHAPADQLDHPGGRDLARVRPFSEGAALALQPSQLAQLGHEAVVPDLVRAASTVLRTRSL